MTAQVSFTSDLKTVAKTLTAKQKEQLPFATALALTRTASLAQTALTSELRSSIDRPTPTTLRAFEVIPAEKKDYPDSFALVGFRDNPGSLSRAQRGRRIKKTGSFFTSGIPYSRYLMPLIRGGSRNQKSFEKRLRKIGLLGADQIIVPGAGAELDRFGNIPRKVYNQILAQLHAFTEAGFDANATEKSSARRRRRKKAAFYLLRNENKKPIAIMQRKGDDKGVPIMVFASAPTYKKQFDFAGVVERVSRSVLGREFKKALLHALKTARK